jgi:hypothetical protein
MRARLYSLLLLVALSAVPAFGQCAMCYTSAKGASTNGQAAITRGVLTLLLPPIGMMLGLVGFAFRYNRRPHENENEAESQAAPAREGQTE